MNIPMMSLFRDIPEKKLLERLKTGNRLFFNSLRDNSALKNAQEYLQELQQGKVPGLGSYTIQPSDLVLPYAAQKQVMLRHITNYTDQPDEMVQIISELDDFYTSVQDGAVKMLCKIQKEKESQLRQNEDLYRDFFENTSDLIHMLDRDERILFVNHKWLITLGYTREEVLNIPFSEFIHHDSIKAYTDAEQKALAGQTTEFIETGFVAKNGELLIMEGNISCKFSDGTFQFIRGVFRNISNRKQMELELASKTRELIRSNSELEQFAYVASHDLQEPLRMVNSYVQLLASRYKDKLDEDANDFINFAIDGSNRMRNLINSLLEYSRVNRVKPFEWVNAGDILSEVLSDMENTILESGAQIHYGHLPTIYADQVLIGQVFQNLIGNAIKFKSERLVHIYITGEKKGDHYLFAFRDNGIGIQKEYLDKIFVIFQRLNSMDKYKGTGIGLAICKKIIEKHGGDIWAESEPGKGTTFYFTLK